MCAVTSAAMNTCWHSPAKEGWFCPSCHQKKVQVFGAMLAESILAVVPHRHFTFTIPKMLRPYFRFHRGLLPFPRESPLHSEFVGRPPATLEKRIPINNTSIPRAFQRLQVQRGSSAVHATGRCGAANEKRHAAEACRRMPTASRTLMIVERLGLPSALSARYKLSRLSPESRATLLIPRARAISPSARAMPVASSGASASHASRYAAISFGVRNCAAMS